MKIKTLIVAVLITFIFFSNSSSIYSLEKETHAILNEKIAQGTINNFSLNTYLINQLGLKGGVNELINNKEVYRWIRDGGKTEDEPFYTRSFNHFHNPLLPWDQAGLKGTFTFKSAILWAQDQGAFGSLFGGNYSWKAVRNYYYLGLTSFTKNDREKNLADTFRGLGQLMHLVEDSSVPAHARNDGHVFYNYETWVDKIRGTDPAKFQNLFSNPVFFGGTINSISTLFDTDQYNGGNPQDTLLNTVGISEYTNANFFSDDTILNNNPTPDQTFPYPRVSSANTQICEDYADGSTDKRKYISRNIAGLCPQAGSGQVDHFATVSLLNEESLITNDNISNLRLWLDDNVHNTYAKELLPRAVGYSAGLLNYFFRGTLEITAPDTYVYSIIDGSVNPQQFTKIKAKVRNTTPNEQIQSGVLQAIAKYKKRTDYAPDLSTDPPTQTSREPEYSYSVSAQWTLSSNEISSLNTAPTEFTFDFTNNPIPAGITDLYLIVVFKGTLGNEVDTAIAAGMKDLKEPTHHTFWNLTDRFSLGIYDAAASAYIYHLYKSDEIKSNPDLADIVDKDGDGIFNEISDPIKPEPYIDPYEITFNISYMEASPPLNPPTILATATVPSGRYMRLIVLVDSKYNNYVRTGWADNIDTPPSAYIDMVFEGVINQDINGVWQTPTPVTIFRGIREHFYTGLLRCEPLAFDPTTMITYCPYPKEEEPPPADATPYQATINFK